MIGWIRTSWTSWASGSTEGGKDAAAVDTLGAIGGLFGLRRGECTCLNPVFAEIGHRGSPFLPREMGSDHAT